MNKRVPGFWLILILIYYHIPISHAARSVYAGMTSPYFDFKDVAVINKPKEYDMDPAIGSWKVKF